MVRKSPLRWRILLFTAIPMVVLALGTLWVVERTVSRQVHDNVEQDLRRAAAVFEDMLGERAEQLRIASDVIVRDPRFFSVLTLPGSHRDAVYRNTVAGVAADFNAITHADLFDVFDAHGVLVASAGRDRAPGAGGDVFERALRERKATQGVIVVGDRPFQVTITPVIAGGRVVGVLRVGARIGQELAGKLRDLTRSDVSFVSGGTMSGSTLADPAARSALLAAAGPDAREMFDLEGGATGTNLTLVRLIPGTSDASGPRYAIQRSLRAETAFLGEIQAGLSQLGLLAILVAVIAGLMIAERITRPLQRIVRAAEEIERGNYDYPIGDKSPDEIGYLARRFDDMRQHERAYVHSLEEVARLKSEFISVASHELRTPISVIRGFQELLVDAMLGPVNEQQKKALVAIGEGTDSLLKIADDATRIAQIEGERIVLAPDDHDVSDLLKAATHDALEEARGRQVTVTLETDRSMPRILVDGPRLSEAVSNLVKNGLRFTPDGGRVDVRAWWRDEELEIEVADDGIGIDPDHLPHVFDRGFVVRGSRNHHSSNTLEFNSAGLGLGLAIARGIVEAHGGTIEVESTPEKGSRFVIRMRPERAEVWRNAA